MSDTASLLILGGLVVIAIIVEVGIAVLDAWLFDDDVWKDK